MSENIRALKVQYDLKVRMVPMRDGVTLETMLYFPVDRPGPYPVLMERHPYLRADRISNRADPVMLKAGVVLVLQACRGTSGSGGEFMPWENHEADDAEDTVAWLKQQPWFSGKLALTGGSYGSQTQFRLAVTGGELTAMRLGVSLGGVWQSMFRHGAFFYYMYAEWAITMFHQLNRDYDNIPDWYARGVFHTLPMMELDRAAGLPEVPWLREWLKHPAYDDYWKKFDIELGYDRITAPAYFRGGWFDIFTEGTLRNFTALRKQGKTARVRKFTRCVMGPWMHGGLANPELFGADCTPGRYWQKQSDRFITGLLADPESDPLPEEPPLRYFVMGSNEWRSAEDWPPPEVREREMYLHSAGHANSRSGDGKLNWTAPEGAEAADTFVSNPADPVPTGGSDTPRPMKQGCNDQTAIQDRTDVLVYTSEPVKETLTVAGRLLARFWVTGDVPGADFTVKLTDVGPDGRAMFRCSGIQRVTDMPQNGEIREIEVECDSTACAFLPGHRLRIEIAGSDFPRYDRNLHTGLPFAESAEMRTAHQKIFHDPEHASRIVLPVL